MEKLTDQQVTVKISNCNICKGIVRVAVEHKMTSKTKKEFAKEVMDYNLSVKEQPLLEYRKENARGPKKSSSKFFLFRISKNRKQFIQNFK